MHFRPPHHAQDSVAVFFRKNLPASNAQDSVIVIEMLNKMHFRQPHHTQDFMIVIVFRKNSPISNAQDSVVIIENVNKMQDRCKCDLTVHADMQSVPSCALIYLEQNFRKCSVYPTQFFPKDIYLEL